MIGEQITALTGSSGRFAALVLSILVWVVGPVWGHEPAEAFLQELKSRGYYDLALEYLDRLESARTAEEDFLPTVDYRQGEVLIQSAMQERTLSRKQTQLDRAQREFEKFTREHPDHPLSRAARGRLGEILMERARILVAQSQQSSGPPERREELSAQARQLFDQAAQTFKDNKSQLQSRLEQIPKSLSPQTDAALIKERDLLRSEYVQAQFVGALVSYEQAMTFAPDSQGRRRLMQQAEEAFTPVAEKYRRRLAGLSAVLFQGRCRQQLGDPRGALAYFEDLLSLPDGEPLLRPLKTKALRGAMECWLDPEVAQYEAARQRAEPWLEQQRTAEQSDDDWLMVQILLAETYHQLVQTGAAGRDKTEMTGEARRLALDVAKYRSDAQQRAQDLLAKLGHVTQTVAQTKPISSFDDAMTAARDALSQRQVAVQTIALLQQRLPRVSEPASREEIEQRLAETQAQQEQAEQSALSLLRQAQDLVTDETPIEGINELRYYLCTLYYYREDYFAAAVLSDFLASRFPSTEEGRRASAVSLASLVRLYGDGRSYGAIKLRDRIQRTAERIAQQWKGQPESDDALATLITLAVHQDQPESAQKYLEQMSVESPKRAVAELTVGQALWSQANQGITPGGDPNAPGKLQAQAVGLLLQGLQHAAGQSPTATTVAAALVVAQHLINTGKASQAIQLLEDGAQGPKTLADQGHPLLESPELKQRVYLLAMMAYIGAISSSDSADEMIDRALSTLDQITKTTAGSANQQQLSSTYVLLARRLQEQIETAPPNRRGAMVTAFSRLLDRAASSSGELSVLNWAADSYVTLGTTLQAGGSNDPADANSYFAKAVSIYKDVLKRIDAGKLTVTAQERLLLDTRLAMALREQGEFAEAIDRFVVILSSQPNQIYVQMEAARTYQRWGDSGRHDAYLKSIFGDRPDPKSNRNVVWGYGRIAKLIASKPDLRDLFHEARYALAECRFQFALQQSAAERMETLEQAEQDILLTARLYPDLGGEERKVKYQSLLQQIQQSMGKRPTGLSS
jgi:hypothetical protein